MSDFVVECPGCETRFRVTEGHLAAANGLVRCGACLGVFRAAEYRQDPEPSPGDADVVETDDEAPDVDESHARRHRPVLDRAEAGGDASMAPGRSHGSAPDLSRTAQFRLPELTEFDADEVRIAEITPPPLPGPRRRWPWAVAALLAVCGLCVQFVYFEFETLSFDARTRPWMAQLCDRIGCDLPQRRAVEEIRSQRLLVRSHPERANGLVVETVLVNRAPWPQAWPVIELRFSDIDGDLVAARRFGPGDYLRGELAGSRDMPVRSPVQIAIEIVDPGNDAVNYEMSLR